MRVMMGWYMMLIKRMDIRFRLTNDLISMSGSPLFFRVCHTMQIGEEQLQENVLLGKATGSYMESRMEAPRFVDVSKRPGEKREEEFIDLDN